MDDKRALLRHFLAAIAYRTQKALRGAPDSFGTFQAGRQVRTPAALVRHMTSVLGFARTFFVGGSYRPEPLPSLGDEVKRLHAMLEDLGRHLEGGSALTGTTEARLLQGPLADAMTHAGQLAMLRRLAGSPVPPEDFIQASVDAENLSVDQPEPVHPDAEWPEAPPSTLLQAGKRVVFLVGASGAGKTTVAEILEARPRWKGHTHYFDTIGVPSPEVMENEFGGGEAWQRWATREWIDRLASDASELHLIEGQTRPSFIVAAAESHPGLEPLIILLDCSAEVRRHRLTELRKRPELANRQMDHWAVYLAGQAHALGLSVIDTSDLGPSAVADAIEAHVDAS